MKKRPVSTHANPPPNALDQELAWYFGYAETAARLGAVTLLPTYVLQTAASESEEARHARAHALHLTVQLVVRGVPTHHASVLRAVYTPRRWPTAVRREFGPVAPIAVRLTCAAHPWLARSSHHGLEHAAAMHLARELAKPETRAKAVRDLEKRARRLMGSAITAYVRARAKRGAT